MLDIARDAKQPTVARLHAIWGVDQIARREDDKAPPICASLHSLLDDKDPIVRAAAAKTLGERGDAESAKMLRALTKDASARVRYFATLSLSKLKDAESLDAVVGLLAENDNRDPAIRHAGIMYLASTKASQVAALATHKSVSVRRAAVVALRRQQSGDLIQFLKDADPHVVLEAARAIHDSPLPVAASALAAMLDQDLAPQEVKLEKTDDDADRDAPLTRRVLNANYRLGTEQAATRLAKYATKITEPIAMRSEALEMLANWKSPDPRDRVLNAHRPLPERDLKIAKAALEPQIDLLASAREPVREKMIDVASAIGIKKIVPMLAKRIVDVESRTELRAAALTALARLDSSFASQTCQAGSAHAHVVPAAIGSESGRRPRQGIFDRQVHCRYRKFRWTGSSTCVGHLVLH